MYPIKVIKGFRPIHFIGEQILFSKGLNLYLSDYSCNNINFLCSIPHSFRQSLLSWFRLTTRIFRIGILPGCVLSANRILLIEKGKIWLVDVESKCIAIDHLIPRGSRPLSIAFLGNLPGFDNYICCYGEYWDNLPKDEVRIWGRAKDGIWSNAYTFPKGTINHVHAIIPDKKRNLVWILTGDFDNGAGIWKATDNFSNVEPVLIGQQDYRCVWMYLTGDDIYYATDSQLEKNSFRKLEITDSKVHSDLIFSIPGSSIYSSILGNSIAFSTIVEPGMPSGFLLYDLFESKIGPGIETKKASLFIWNQVNGLREVIALKKDILPPRLCQFGSFSFPVGDNPLSERLYVYVTALSQYEDCTLVFDLKECCV